MFCPACLFLKILEFVSVVYRLLAAEDAGLPSQGHAVVSRIDLLPSQTTPCVSVGLSTMDNSGFRAFAVQRKEERAQKDQAKPAV